MKTEKPKQWIYHKEEKPKVVDQDDVQSYFDDGWADSPAAFFDLDENGFDSGSEMDVQIVGSALKGVKDAANGALNLKGMTKEELVDYAKEHLSFELSIKKKSQKKLVKEIEKLLEQKDDDSKKDS